MKRAGPLLYGGKVLKSRDGIPRPAIPPPGTVMVQEAQTARSRFYPVTIAYTAYAVVVRGRDVAFGLSSDLWDVPFGTRIPPAPVEEFDRPPIFIQGDRR
jgi:hypothetical protein